MWGNLKSPTGCWAAPFDDGIAWFMMARASLLNLNASDETTPDVTANRCNDSGALVALKRD
jgi:hypothetical protein